MVDENADLIHVLQEIPPTGFVIMTAKFPRQKKSILSSALSCHFFSLHLTLVTWERLLFLLSFFAFDTRYHGISSVVLIALGRDLLPVRYSRFERKN